MNIETVDELVDQLADWLGIYGGCKNPHDATSCETKCELDTKRPFCCRNGFASEMENRIRQSVKNEEELSKLHLGAVSDSVCDHNWKEWEDSSCNAQMRCTSCKKIFKAN